MDAIGYYRVTGLLQKISVTEKVGAVQLKLNGFFVFSRSIKRYECIFENTTDHSEKTF